ncbi:RAB, member of RAS oncogene family-like 2A, isoform CRA_a [Rattus norvegicus]|uniref:RAB, member of RAS oncogene family-like 2A, isoform CRA_a n=1 Tax=Rattus norvegicus TaxID=10116 RepID=A6K7P1_RAT|nr:RAB, member of RAS oncogene family-like 2A, isoform CRA_a [Rattus norvegicus]
MAGDRSKQGELDQEKYDAHENVKIICLGDSAVGKSKLMERFLMDGFQPQQLSTYALTLYKHTATVDGKTILVDFWDTAGQERFQSMHASYYHKAHACIMVFDVQRKITYKNLGTWYAELREFRPEIPCILVANKIDGGPSLHLGDSSSRDQAPHISFFQRMGSLCFSFPRYSFSHRDASSKTLSSQDTDP